MDEKVGGLRYYCVCIPNTDSLAGEVNKILEQNRDKVLIKETFTTTPYFKKVITKEEEVKSSPDGVFYIQVLWFRDR